MSVVAVCGGVSGSDDRVVCVESGERGFVGP
jgi:hypothetical protein